MASLSVLERFPERGDGNGPDGALLVAERGIDQLRLVGRGCVIEERLGKTLLAPEEHSCWLTAGFLVAPERYREDFRTLTADYPLRKWLSRFVAVRFPMDFARRLAARDVASLVCRDGSGVKA